jgi:nucleotide-binding universal stress UspA family protein
MAPFDRILLCYDATPQGRRALTCGAALSKALHCDTHLLALMDCSHWTRGFDILATVDYRVEEDSAKEILLEAVEEMEHRGIEVTGHFRTGDPLLCIPELAESVRADLIVIGHRRCGAFARWWNGENHAVLLDRLSCGVLFQVSE